MKMTIETRFKTVILNSSERIRLGNLGFWSGDK
jgi:hypothetical protein